MKASIITMTRTYNYGATLQAYALQEYINQMGHDCEIIDHMRVCNQAHRKVAISDLSLNNIISFPYKYRLEKGYYNFEKFYDEFMNMGKYYDDNTLISNPPNYDVYITGSDQVWNPRYIKEKFYLSFVRKGIKISYAASLGVSEVPDDKKEIMSDLINNMDMISVREEQGKEMIEELTDKKVNRNCDPIYLLTQQQWRSIEKSVDLEENEYILCYMIYKPKWLNEWLKTIKKQTNKKIVFVGLSGYRKVYCDEFIRDAGPREFLWLIDHAYAVVTSSFHGTAFSIMFNKPFIAMPDPPRPDRIKNLLNLFEIKGHILINNEKINFDQINSLKIEDIMKKERECSNKYLKAAFEEGM